MTNGLKKHGPAVAGGSKWRARILGYGAIGAVIYGAASHVSLPSLPSMPSFSLPQLDLDFGWLRNLKQEVTPRVEDARRQQNELMAMASGHDPQLNRVLGDIFRRKFNDPSAFEYGAYTLALPPAREFNASARMVVCYEDALSSQLRIEAYRLPLNKGQKAEMVTPPMVISGSRSDCRASLGL